jgi:hypothetical protein
MSVVLRTEYEDITLQFRAAYIGAYTDVKASGDGWEVWADGQFSKNALVRVLANLTRENYEKLKVLGSLSRPYQFDRYFDFQKVMAAELIALRESYDLAKETVNKVVSVNGEKCLIVPGRAGPALLRTFITYRRPGYFRADVDWNGFRDALDGKGLNWKETTSGCVWHESRTGIGSKRAIKLLKELSEEGFKQLSAAVLVGMTS